MVLVVVCVPSCPIVVIDNGDAPTADFAQQRNEVSRAYLLWLGAKPRAMVHRPVYGGEEQVLLPDVDGPDNLTSVVRGGR